MNIQRGDSHPIPFFMASSADRVSGVTGLGNTPTVTLFKNCGGPSTPAGTVSEVGYGSYKLSPTAADTDTYGFLIVHAEASGCVPYDTVIQVVSSNPY